MKRIALDVMGTDLGMLPILTASCLFLKKNHDVKIIFVGDEQQIKEGLSKLTIKQEQYNIVSATEVINQTDGIMEVRRKPNSSMVKAIEMVANDDADAVVSGGSTPAYLSGCHFILKEIDNVERPAFMPFIPTIIKEKIVIMLDVGASLENSPKDLHNFAKMATLYAQTILHIKDPAVGLLNIGQEASKGKEYHRKTHEILTNDESINFFGNIEPREITSGIVDIIVTDGYTGNIALKAIEGMAKNLMKVIKTELTKNLWRKLKALTLRKAFVGVKETFDYKNHAAALVLGLNKIAIKTHGSSDVKSFESTLNIASEAIGNDIANKINELINPHIADTKRRQHKEDESN